jgi:opacity protein-like surface antigen
MRRDVVKSKSMCSVALAAATGVAALLAAPAAQAQAPAKGVYAGFNAGQANYKWRNPPAGASTDICSSPGLLDCDEKPAGYKLYAGYNINSWLGVEGVYYYHGRSRIRFDALGTIVDQSILLNGFGANLVATAPLGNAFISGRVGYAAATSTRKDTVLGQTDTHERSEGQPMLGAAVGFKVWRNLVVRADWDRVRGETSFNEKFESDLFSVGVMWQF